MFAIETPQVIHTIDFRSSGASAPRAMKLDLCTVRYRSALTHPPTFLATADLQGREMADSNRLLGELLADEIRILQELDELPGIDLCFLCGDFYDYPDLRKLGGTGDVTSAFNALAGISDKTAIVLGNHDTVRAEDLDSRAQVLDGDALKLGDLTIGGVGGIIGDPKRNNRKRETDFLAAIRKVSTMRTNVLLLHQGPEGLSDSQRGCRQINDVLRDRSDLLVLFGHCHWPHAFHQERSHLFCNVDARALVFIPQSNS